MYTSKSVIAIGLILSIFVLIASSIAKRCMNTPDKCKEGGNEMFVNISLAAGVIGTVIFLFLLPYLNYSNRSIHVNVKQDSDSPGLIKFE
jgi:hypothetical protein